MRAQLVAVADAVPILVHVTVAIPVATAPGSGTAGTVVPGDHVHAGVARVRGRIGCRGRGSDGDDRDDRQDEQGDGPPGRSKFLDHCLLHLDSLP